MRFMSAKKNAPGSAATDVQGDDTKISTTEKESPVTVPAIPTSSEVLATLDVGAGMNTTAISRVVGASPSSGQSLVELAGYDCLNDDGTTPPPRWYIEFAQANLNGAELHPRDIPQLIDTLNEMRETWIRLDPDCFE